MALTRKMLKAMGIEDEKIDQIIEAHTETVDALKAERDGFKTEAAGAAEVKAELEKLKDAAKNSGDYNKLKKEFDDYKAEVANRETLAAKKAVLSKIAKDAGLSEAGIAKALKYTDFGAVELDDKGEAKDGKALLKSLKEEWSEYIQTTHTEGAKTSTPPATEKGGAVKSKKEIMEIKDTTERQNEWKKYIISKNERT